MRVLLAYMWMCRSSSGEGAGAALHGRHWIAEVVAEAVYAQRQQDGDVQGDVLGERMELRFQSPISIDGQGGEFRHRSRCGVRVCLAGMGWREWLGMRHQARAS